MDGPSFIAVLYIGAPLWLISVVLHRIAVAIEALKPALKGEERNG